MRSKNHAIVRELDLESISGMSDTEIKHYMSLGYKPYLLADGSTKWLTMAQRVYRDSQYAPKWSLKTLFTKNTQKTKYRRKRGNRVMRFLKKHWVFLTLVATAVATILLVLNFGLFL